MRNRAENQVTLVFIRHGMTEANREHRYLGRTDEPLSEEGKACLRQAKCVGRYPEVDILFSSPMKRCLETAGILYPDRQMVVVPEWEEMDFGAFEGKNYTELQGDARYQAWIDSNGTLPFPEGESRERFTERCVRGFEGILERLTEEHSASMEQQSDMVLSEGRSIGLIVHGGTIMVLLSSFCGGDYFDYQVPNGDGYVCTLGRSKGKPVLEISNTLSDVGKNFHEPNQHQGSRA